MSKANLKRWAFNYSNDSNVALSWLFTQSVSAEILHTGGRASIKGVTLVDHHQTIAQGRILICKPGAEH